MAESKLSLVNIAGAFLKIGAMSYGGPAIMGIMQAELQEKRQWIDKARFVEGLALVNMLPGPGATQLGIFIGYAARGIAGGIVAGLCFILPAFVIMPGLAFAYAAWGALPAIHSAFYGIGPVVLAIFIVAVYRLGRSTIKEKSQLAIAIGAGLIMWLSPLGVVAVLVSAGCTGIALFNSRRHGLAALAIVASVYAVASQVHITGAGDVANGSYGVGLDDFVTFFLKVGTFTFGGGLSMLAFMEEQVVANLGWLTHQEFVDGLALSQLTPGPILMLAAFIGFKLHGVAGAASAATAIFLPSFVMMLTLLPALHHMKNLGWLKAFMRGAAAAVVGALAVSLAQIAPHAAPDGFASMILVVTIVLMLWRKTRPLPMMLAGAAIGVVAKGGRLFSGMRELTGLA